MKKILLALSLLVGFSAQAAEFTISVNKAGQVLTSVTPACPAGSVLADGHQLSRSAYARLFAIMGEGYGSGDGSTTFNLPDYRGLFLRSGSSVNDPDFPARAAGGTFPNITNDTKIGSVQLDENKYHNHVQDSHYHVSGARMEGQAFAYGQTYAPAGNMIRDGASNTTEPYGANTSPVTATNQPSGGNESRPKNAAVTFCVTY